MRRTGFALPAASLGAALWRSCFYERSPAGEALSWRAFDRGDMAMDRYMATLAPAPGKD